MRDHALAITNISKSFGNTKALDQVSFQVPQGSIFGLLGPNGAGKTTLFSIIAGFLFSDSRSGGIQVLGIDVRHVSQLQGRMSILPQDAQFQRNVPILEQLVFFRMLDGQDRATATAEVQETLTRVGLDGYGKRGVHALSHGMLKRLGIAQAFLGRPEVIILDEPTSGLDPQNARQIRDLIRELQATRSATTVISSHNLYEIQELCDHVAILDHGRVVAAGPVTQFTGANRRLEVELSRALTDEDQRTLLALPGMVGIEAKGTRKYHLNFDGRNGEDGDTDAAIAQTLRTLLDLNCIPRQLREGGNLEEVFLQLTGGKENSGRE